MITTLEGVQPAECKTSALINTAAGSNPGRSTTNRRSDIWFTLFDLAGAAEASVRTKIWPCWTCEDKQSFVMTVDASGTRTVSANVVLLLLKRRGCSQRAPTIKGCSSRPGLVSTELSLRSSRKRAKQIVQGEWAGSLPPWSVSCGFTHNVFIITFQNS